MKIPPETLADAMRLLSELITEYSEDMDCNDELAGLIEDIMVNFVIGFLQ